MGKPHTHPNKKYREGGAPDDLFPSPFNPNRLSDRETLVKIAKPTHSVKMMRGKVETPFRASS
jgi:hypothetical protein